MNKNALHSAIDNIKASDDFKKKVSKSMMEKNTGKANVRSNYKKVSLIAASFLLVAGILGMSIKHLANQSDSCGGNKIYNMFLSNNKLYYQKSGKILYEYNRSTGKSKIASTLNIKSGSQIFENKGYIYYSNGNTIYQKLLVNDSPKKLVKGKGIWVDIVNDDKLIYHKAYKDNNGGFSEFEHRIYDLKTGKDSLLFKPSKDFWHFLALSGNKVIADGYLQDDYGIYSIDLVSKTYKKLSNMRSEPIDVSIVNDTMYFVSKGLWSVKMNGDKLEEIPLPAMANKEFMITSVAGYGDTLYVSTACEDKNNLMSLDLKTGKSSVLTEEPNRIWHIRTDGKILYYSLTPIDQSDGQVKSISLCEEP